MKLTQYTPRINVKELKALTCCPDCFKTIHSAIMGIRGEDAKLRVLFLRDQLRDHKKAIKLDPELEKMFDDKLMEFEEVEEVDNIEVVITKKKGKKHASKKETD
jgi:hypothetical protein